MQKEIARRAAHYAKPCEVRSYPLTGLVKCGKCGSPYKRKTTAYNIVWICRTYDQMGKHFCANQQIPENILLEKVEEVGGIDLAHEIIVPEKNQLIFRMENGETYETEWHNRSRREAWTPEKRDAARQKTLERRKSHGET